MPDGHVPDIMSCFVSQHMVHAITQHSAPSQHSPVHSIPCMVGVKFFPGFKFFLFPLHVGTNWSWFETLGRYLGMNRHWRV